MRRISRGGCKLPVHAVMERQIVASLEQRLLQHFGRAAVHDQPPGLLSGQHQARLYPAAKTKSEQWTHW